MPDLSIVLPTWNEKGNIIHLLKALVSNLDKRGAGEFEILVIDDNSDDGTGEAVSEFSLKETRVRLTIRKDERGLASAVRFGLEHSQGDIVVLMDSDFNHDPKDVPRLLDLVGDHDIVVGSRYIKGGFMESSWLRHYLSYFFNLFVRLYLGINTTDNLSGFMAIKKDVFDGMDLDMIFRGFGEFHIRFIYWAFLKGLKIVEIPVIYNERVYGTSKFKPLENLINYSRAVIQSKKEIRID